MRRAAVRLAGRRGASSASSSASGLWRTDLRAAKAEQVGSAREAVFGPQGDMPGDRYFRKKLEGRKLMRWYFPSKYSFQDFRVEDYFEMQAERFAERELHGSIDGVQALLAEVSKRREGVRRFFNNVDEATFHNNPSLQDLYGAFRLVDADDAASPALKFKLGNAVFMEHTPLGGAQPPLHTMGREEALERDGKALDSELVAVWLAVQDALSSDAAKALESKLLEMNSNEDVRKVLTDKAQELGVVLPLSQTTVVFDEVSAPANASAEAGERRPRGRAASRRMVSHLVRQKAAGEGKAPESLDKELRDYGSRRHRFIDPMYRRRRLKWLERQMSSKNKPKEVKFNSYYAVHPDEEKEWPTNKGSVTVIWPSPYH